MLSWIISSLFSDLSDSNFCSLTSFWNVFIAGGFLYPVSSQNIFIALELNIAGAPPLFLFIASNKLATDPAASGSFKIFNKFLRFFLDF